jgi:hypothetical protein
MLNEIFEPRRPVFSATGVLQETARTRNFLRPLPFSIPTISDLGVRIAHSDPPAILIFHSLLIELFNLETQHRHNTNLYIL